MNHAMVTIHEKQNTGKYAIAAQPAIVSHLCSFIKPRAIIILIILFLIIPGRTIIAAGGETKQNIVIHNFQVIDNTTARPDDKKKKKQKESYQYYSFIIPDTISKNLSVENRYTVTRNNDVLTIRSSFADGDEQKAYLKQLQKTGKDKKADFIVTGTCTINDDSLEISITIFNVRGRETATSSNSTRELGVVIRESTDYISSTIEKNIREMNSSNTERFKPSPFLAPYGVLSIISVGFDYGYTFITGDWGDMYNSGYSSSIYIMFDINRSFAASLEYINLQADDEGKETSNGSLYLMQGLAINLNHRLYLADSFALFLSYGGGLSKTKILTEYQYPFVLPLEENTEVDLFAGVSTGIELHFSSFSFRAGGVFKRIFYDGTAMDICTAFGGFSIHF